jgi:hypothetical protein
VPCTQSRWNAQWGTPIGANETTDINDMATTAVCGRRCCGAGALAQVENLPRRQSGGGSGLGNATNLRLIMVTPP